ncbi:MAG: hypothetical protein ABFD23_06905 [Caldisericales bacterium]|jgi:hypothetical protein|nr:hypothetical protein [Caldisericia bacterium]MCE5177192.1 hypothetical protein [bacterium]NMD14323.1 hypothetical protein [Caldisericales bacterium]
MKIAIEIIGGAIWGCGLGFAWFHLLYLQTQKSFMKGQTVITNPLRLLIAALALFAPVLLGFYVLLASFGGFALGFGLWWIWFTKFKRGGKNG